MTSAATMASVSTPLYCEICYGSGHETVYNGPIRAGRFGTLTDVAYRVQRCRSCGIDRLDPLPIDPTAYESGRYRQSVDGTSDIAAYHANHDGDLAGRLALVGSAALRGHVVMDVGCGSGAFLDLLKGVAAQTIAVEPQHSFGQVLRDNGHDCYRYASELAVLAPGTVDLAFSFHVIEHVAHPGAFLRDIATCLKPGGRLHLTTPNRDEILMAIGPAAYKAFFYRRAHLWYFDRASLARAGDMMGLRLVEFTTPHHYDLANFAVWLRDGRPSGLGAIPELGGVADAAYRTQVEVSGRGDLLYAVFERTPHR